MTAEGVECEAVAAWLRAHGCDAAQGYLFGRPAHWLELLAAFAPTTTTATTT